ncbi:cytochrome P450 6k1-like [Xylocopa sonorina]|uniref:cytochrome P450 6k1-like n=1 Tax=Xylocopa sonorina TaxID=1818115 RepID=UPI00403AAB7B
MIALYSFFINVFLTIIALVTILVLYVKRQRTYWQRRGVPTLPNSHWLYGNAKELFKLERSPGFLIGELHLQGSDNDLLGIYIFHKPFLLLRNPELIKQILVKDFNYFPNRYFTARSLQDEIGSTNLFTIENPPWRYVRTKLSPVFTSGKIKKIFNLLVVTAEPMCKYLEQQCSNDTRSKTIMMKEVAGKYITDIISSVAFGIETNSFDPAGETFFRKAQEALKLTFHRALQYAIMFFFPQISPYIGTRILGSSTNYFRKVFWDSLDTRETSKTKRGDLVDFLIGLKNQKQETDFQFKGDALLSQSVIFFIAGRESSVTAICFTLYELAKNPEIQKRTRDEIHEKLKEHGMTYEGIQSMKYLHQVMSETLRLYPPAPLLDRVAVDDYKVPGTDIVLEKGMPVYVALCGLHRDPKYHPDPLRFNPDRFSDENKDNITQCTYMPFGEGPRICIGVRLGFLQSVMALVAILKDYESSLDSTCKCDVDNRNIFITPANDFSIKLTKL